jgi:hypothetical protein
MKLPCYIHGYVDRHGSARYYFRRAGFQQVRLRGVPWSPDFMVAYERALAGQPETIGAARVLPGSMHALAISYYTSPDFLVKLTPGSQRARRNVIEICARPTRTASVTATSARRSCSGNMSCGSWRPCRSQSNRKFAGHGRVSQALPCQHLES